MPEPGDHPDRNDHEMLRRKVASEAITSRRPRLTAEEREARAAAKVARAEAAAIKRRGEDMPCLPELQRAWREEVARARGIGAEDVTITGRALSAARGYLGRRYQAVAPGRPLTPADESRIVDDARALFRSALATERPQFPIGLQIVMTDPDRFEGQRASGPTTAEERRNMARQGSSHVKPGKEGGNTHVPTAEDMARMRAKLARMVGGK